MKIDPTDWPGREVYGLMTSLVVPRPIAWVGTRSAEGVDNLAPFSYFMAVSSRPAAVAISVARAGRAPDGEVLLKDTARNVLETEVLTVSLVSRTTGQAMVDTSGRWPSHDSEFDACDLEALPGDRVAAPRPAVAEVSMECRLSHTVDMGTTHLFVAEVLLFHLADRLVPATTLEGRLPRVHARELDPLARLGGRDYTGLGELLQLVARRRPDD